MRSSRVLTALCASIIPAVYALSISASGSLGTATPATGLSPFAQRALAIVSAQPIVQHNPYCEWFENGTATLPEVQELVKQFSVFSQLFLLAQLSKVINAPTLDTMREGKEILANEIGVVFNSKGKKRLEGTSVFDPSIVSAVGTVEGGVYTHRAAHFEWLCDVGTSVGLGFDDLGKRRLGTEATLHFCDALFDIYGSDDLSTSLGASFAIEHWANAGFWDSLVGGFEVLNGADSLPQKVPLGFWRFHQKLEAQHASHTMDELEEAYAAGLITDEGAFEKAAEDILEACGVFWYGLDAHRKGDAFEVKGKIVV